MIIRTETPTELGDHWVTRTETHPDAYRHAREVLLRSLADGIVWELGRIQVRATGPTRWAAFEDGVEIGRGTL